MWDYIIAGVLAALVSIALTDTTLLWPTWNRQGLRLGVIARLLIGAAVAWLWDHNIAQAFIASVVGCIATAYVRKLTKALTNSTGQNPDMMRLAQVKRRLAVAQQNAAYFAHDEVPNEVLVQIEECEREIKELEKKVDPWGSF